MKLGEDEFNNNQKGKKGHWEPLRRFSKEHAMKEAILESAEAVIHAFYVAEKLELMKSG